MTKEFSTVGVFGKRDSLDYEPLRIIAELLIKSGRQVLLEKKPAEALSLGEGYTRDEIGKNPTSLSLRRRRNFLRRFPPHGALRCTLHRY